MNKIAKALTNYIIRKGIIDKTEQTIYEYGFTITIEAGLFILFCIFIILHLHMFIEGILFFITFAIKNLCWRSTFRKISFLFCFILPYILWNTINCNVRPYSYLFFVNSCFLIRNIRLYLVSS